MSTAWVRCNRVGCALKWSWLGLSTTCSNSHGKVDASDDWLLVAFCSDQLVVYYWCTASLLQMFQKAAKTVDDVPPKQTSRTPAVKRDRGDRDSRPGKTFDLSQSVFPPAQSPVKHSSPSAAASSRDESKTVNCCRRLTLSLPREFVLWCVLAVWERNDYYVRFGSLHRKC